MVKKQVRSILEDFSISITEIEANKYNVYIVEHNRTYLPYMLKRLDKWGYTCSHTDTVTDDVVMTKFEFKQTNEWGM